MKLRNKETGEIGNLKSLNNDKRVYVWIDKETDLDFIYNSLAELNKEWEDYEEPKQYWFIATDGRVLECNEYANEDACWNGEKAIGNFFETKEEAELAVRKLKAWQRLKDKELKILGFHSKDRLIADSDKKWRFIIEAEIDSSVIDNEDGCEMINLLFGGEE